MILQESGVKLDISDISEFEAELKIKLPQQYKNFMLQNNGGVPDKKLTFSFIESGSKSSCSSTIEEFLVIYPPCEISLYNDVKIAYSTLVEENDIPATLFPVALDEFDNIILISISGDDIGKIYFANYEVKDTETGFLVISLIADSFQEFITTLQ